MFFAYYIYILLIVVLSFLAYHYSKTNKRAFLYALIAIFTLVIGLRYDVGDDYMSYKNYYFNNSLFPNMEKGYALINILFKSLDFHYCTVFLLSSFLMIFLFTKAQDKFKFVLPWSLYFLFTTLELFIWDNVIRQSLAFCFFLFSVRFVQERKMVPYMICIVLAILFHKTAFPLVVFYFLLPLNVKDDRKYQYVILFASFLLGTVIKMFLFSQIAFLADLIGSQTSEGNNTVLQKLDFANSKNSLGVATFIWLAIDSICIYFYPKMKKLHENVGYEYYYKLYFIGIVLNNSIGGTYFDRVNMYFLPFRIVIYAFLMYEFSRMKGMNYKVPMLMVSGLTFLLFLWAINNKASRCAPYQFVEFETFPTTSSFYN